MLRLDEVSQRYHPPPAWLRPLVRTASRGPVDALRDVSLEAAGGEVLGLVGPNGAGKTTLIRIAASLLAPTQGSVRVCGIDAVRHPLEARRCIGLVPADDRTLYWRLTGRANLEFHGVMAGLGRSKARERAERLLSEMELESSDRLVFGYSSGMRARLALARALMAEPPVLLLDEPTRSLDPAASGRTLARLRSVAAEGRTVLLASHRLDEVAAVCDRVAVLLEGRVSYVGATEGGSTEIADLLTADDLTP